uniref:hypothetical protein n=1 Tax=Cupriavidus taiwanensis TaxID=164546 RepID=UPI00358E9676
MNPNLLVKGRRSLHAGEYDPVALLPVTVEAPMQEMEHPAPAPVFNAATAGAIEISVGNTFARIEGWPQRSHVTAGAPHVARYIGIGSMNGLPNRTRIWLAAGVTDMRSGFNIPAAKVQTYGARIDQRDGMCLTMKRLGRGPFVWPRADGGVVCLHRLAATRTRG